MNPLATFIRSQTTWPFRASVRPLSVEGRLSRRHRSSLKQVPRFLHSLPLRLNLGSGPNRRAGWVNVDLFHAAADLHLDLRDPWPFPDGSVSHVYSEHVFEHFEFHSEVPHFLSQSLRVLRPGGLFDVGVPDTEWPLRAYGHPEDKYWSFVKSGIHPKWCETQLDHINYHFRQDGEHLYAWDEGTLVRTLNRSGFTAVERRDFDPALDTESRRTGTLYMRAIKPTTREPHRR